jgi:hypothetical protein
MSLIRQMWLVVLTTVVLAFAGSFAVTIVSAREYVQTQLRVKNSDNAAALALSLSQQGGDRELMELLVAAQFDTGFYEQISFAGTDGRVIERLMRQVPVDAPASSAMQPMPIATSCGRRCRRPFGCPSSDCWPDGWGISWWGVSVAPWVRRYARRRHW